MAAAGPRPPPRAGRGMGRGGGVGTPVTAAADAVTAVNAVTVVPAASPEHRRNVPVMPGQKRSTVHVGVAKGQQGRQIERLFPQS